MLIDGPLVSKRLSVKSVRREKDIARIVSWLSDSETVKYMEARFQVPSIKDQVVYIE